MTSTVPRPLWLLSAALVLMHVGMAWAYLAPRYVSRPLTNGQVSIVRYIDSLGPVWIVAFSVVAAALAGALWLCPRWLWLAHLLGGGVMASYSVASWIGAELSRPPSPIPAAVMATFIALAQFTSAWVSWRRMAPR